MMEIPAYEKGPEKEIETKGVEVTTENGLIEEKILSSSSGCSEEKVPVSREGIERDKNDNFGTEITQNCLKSTTMEMGGENKGSILEEDESREASNPHMEKQCDTDAIMTDIANLTTSISEGIACQTEEHTGIVGNEVLPEQPSLDKSKEEACAAILSRGTEDVLNDDGSGAMEDTSGSETNISDDKKYHTDYVPKDNSSEHKEISKDSNSSTSIVSSKCTNDDMRDTSCSETNVATDKKYDTDSVPKDNDAEKKEIRKDSKGSIDVELSKDANDDVEDTSASESNIGDNKKCNIDSKRKDNDFESKEISTDSKDSNIVGSSEKNNSDGKDTSASGTDIEDNKKCSIEPVPKDDNSENREISKDTKDSNIVGPFKCTNGSLVAKEGRSSFAATVIDKMREVAKKVLSKRMASNEGKEKNDGFNGAKPNLIAPQRSEPIKGEETNGNSQSQLLSGDAKEGLLENFQPVLTGINAEESSNEVPTAEKICSMELLDKGVASHDERKVKELSTEKDADLKLQEDKIPDQNCEPTSCNYAVNSKEVYSTDGAKAQENDMESCSTKEDQQTESEKMDSKVMTTASVGDVLDSKPEDTKCGSGTSITVDKKDELGEEKYENIFDKIRSENEIVREQEAMEIASSLFFENSEEENEDEDDNSASYGETSRRNDEINEESGKWLGKDWCDKSSSNCSDLDIISCKETDKDISSDGQSSTLTAAQRLIEKFKLPIRNDVPDGNSDGKTQKRGREMPANKKITIEDEDEHADNGSQNSNLELLLEKKRAKLTIDAIAKSCNKTTQQKKTARKDNITSSSKALLRLPPQLMNIKGSAKNIKGKPGSIIRNRGRVESKEVLNSKKAQESNSRNMTESPHSMDKMILVDKNNMTSVNKHTATSVDKYRGVPVDRHAITSVDGQGAGGGIKAKIVSAKGIGTDIEEDKTSRKRSRESSHSSGASKKAGTYKVCVKIMCAEKASYVKQTNRGPVKVCDKSVQIVTLKKRLVPENITESGALDLLKNKSSTAGNSNLEDEKVKGYKIVWKIADDSAQQLKDLEMAPEKNQGDRNKGENNAQNECLGTTGGGNNELEVVDTLGNWSVETPSRDVLRTEIESTIKATYTHTTSKFTASNKTTAASNREEFTASVSTNMSYGLKLDTIDLTDEGTKRHGLKKQVPRTMPHSKIVSLNRGGHNVGSARGNLMIRGNVAPTFSDSVQVSFSRSGHPKSGSFTQSLSPNVIKVPSASSTVSQKSDMFPKIVGIFSLAKPGETGRDSNIGNNQVELSLNGNAKSNQKTNLATEHSTLPATMSLGVVNKSSLKSILTSNSTLHHRQHLLSKSGANMSAPRGIPVSRQQLVSVSRQQMIPVSRPEVIPVSKQGIPVLDQQYNPVSRQHYVTISKPQAIPASREQRIPSSMTLTIPDVKQQMTSVIRKQGMPVSRNQVIPTSRQQVVPVLRQQDIPLSFPQANPVSMEHVAPVSMQQGVPMMMQQRNPRSIQQESILRGNDPSWALQDRTMTKQKDNAMPRQQIPGSLLQAPEPVPTCQSFTTSSHPRVILVQDNEGQYALVPINMPMNEISPNSALSIAGDPSPLPVGSTLPQNLNVPQKLPSSLPTNHPSVTTAPESMVTSLEPMQSKLNALSSSSWVSQPTPTNLPKVARTQAPGCVDNVMKIKSFNNKTDSIQPAPHGHLGLNSNSDDFKHQNLSNNPAISSLILAINENIRKVKGNILSSSFGSSLVNSESTTTSGIAGNTLESLTISKTINTESSEKTSECQASTAKENSSSTLTEASGNLSASSAQQQQSPGANEASSTAQTVASKEVCDTSPFWLKHASKNKLPDHSRCELKSSVFRNISKRSTNYQCHMANQVAEKCPKGSDFDVVKQIAENCSNSIKRDFRIKFGVFENQFMLVNRGRSKPSILPDCKDQEFTRILGLECVVEMLKDCEKALEDAKDCSEKDQWRFGDSQEASQRKMRVSLKRKLEEVSEGDGASRNEKTTRLMQSEKEEDIRKEQQMLSDCKSEMASHKDNVKINGKTIGNTDSVEKEARDLNGHLDLGVKVKSRVSVGENDCEMPLAQTDAKVECSNAYGKPLPSKSPKQRESGDVKKGNENLMVVKNSDQELMIVKKNAEGLIIVKKRGEELIVSKESLSEKRREQQNRKGPKRIKSVNGFEVRELFVGVEDILL